MHPSTVVTRHGQGMGFLRRHGVHEHPAERRVGLAAMSSMNTDSDNPLGICTPGSARPVRHYGGVPESRSYRRLTYRDHGRQDRAQSSAFTAENGSTGDNSPCDVALIRLPYDAAGIACPFSVEGISCRARAIAPAPPRSIGN